MDRWHYLLALAGCLLVTLPLELLPGVRVLRRPGRLALTVLPVLAVFVSWDLLAHDRGHWWFSEHYTLGWRVAGLPVEEWLFFVVVPVCGVYAYEAVGAVLSRRGGRFPAPQGAPLTVIDTSGAPSSGPPASGAPSSGGAVPGA